MFGQLSIVAMLFVSLCLGAGARTTELPPGAVVLDPDIIWDVANPNSFALSPDGQHIAYISKGALWVCRVDAGPPSKLADLPNTITAILAAPANREQRELSAASPHNPRFQAFYGPVHLDKHYVLSLAWSADQDGLFYVVRKRVGENTPVAAHHVMHASLDGKVEELALIEGEFGVPQEYETSFHVTPDYKFVVIRSYAPLIWNLESGQPRVTPFEYLLPSSTSGRFLGIEIDTRELVLVDEQFRIAKRFDIRFPVQQRVDLAWSADERFAVCRRCTTHEKYEANAFRIDLATGERTPLSKTNMKDRFLFTGNGGELLHLRVAAKRVWGYSSGELGTCITLVNSDGTKRNVFITKQIRRPEKGQRGTIYPPLIAASDGSHVAVAVPRPEEQAPGAHFHLVDRRGRAQPFVPVSDASYITPYFPITFADGGRRLISRSGSTLFSLRFSEVAPRGDASDDD